MAHDVFISHSHVDKAIADAVCATLESNKIRCWIAPRDIAPGVDWPTSISTAISKSRVFILIFSENSNRSEDVGRELILAANSNLVIIPFRIENAIPEPGKQYYLARTHWLDAMNPPTQEQIENLVAAVKIFLTKREKSKLVGLNKITTPGESFTYESKNEKLISERKSRSKRLLAGIIAFVLVIALTITVWWFNNQKRSLKPPVEENMVAAITNTATLQATVYEAPTSTLELEPTPTEVPEWVNDFVEPIRTLASEHGPNLFDGFEDEFYTRGRWLDTSHYPPNPLKYQNEMLQLSNVQLPWTFWYTDYVMEFSWRFEGEEIDHWSFYVRNGEASIVFHEDHMGIVKTPRDHNVYYFEPSDEMNHTMIIVKDESMAVMINDQPVYYGDFLPTEWKSGESIFMINKSTILIDNVAIWNLNDLRR